MVLPLYPQYITGQWEKGVWVLRFAWVPPWGVYLVFPIPVQTSDKISKLILLLDGFQKKAEGAEPLYRTGTPTLVFPPPPSQKACFLVQCTNDSHKLADLAIMRQILDTVKSMTPQQSCLCQRFDALVSTYWH